MGFRKEDWLEGEGGVIGRSTMGYHRGENGGRKDLVQGNKAPVDHFGGGRAKLRERF